jgi:probable rRNA maturation factor
LNIQSDINFYFEEIETFPFSDHKLRKWIVFIIEQEDGNPGVINFIFCNDDYLFKLNIDFLQHDTLTDIITFDYSEEFENVSGDIFISTERVKENAMELGITFHEELERIIAHGVLHLLGYDDKNETVKEEMTYKENFYLRHFYNQE